MTKFQGIMQQPMSLVVYVKNEHGIVLAGDKRSVYADSLHSYKDTSTKVYKLNTLVGIAAVGDGDDAQPIIDEILSMATNDKDVAECSQEIFSLIKTRHAPFMATDQILLGNLGKVTIPNYGFIICGYTHSGLCKMYTINTGDLRIRERDDSFYQEGIPEIAKYIFTREYKKTHTLKDLEKLAVRTIIETATVSYAVSAAHDTVVLQKPE